MSKVYLLLGGNMGDKRAVFARATTLIDERVGRVTKQSSIYETEPWGFESHEMFWNQVLEIQTRIPAQKVLELILQIEQQLGRTRTGTQYGSRMIDIDILFYDDQIITLPDLSIPHPRIQDRKFVLVPLNEIVPEMIHPRLQMSTEQLLAVCKDELRVDKVND